MIEIKISTNSPYWPLERQTPHWSAQWGNCRFHINRPVEACDYWVVLGGLTVKEYTKCLKENTIFIPWEPPSVHTHQQAFLDQFALILSCRPDIMHPHIIYTQPALPWMIGGRFRPETASWAAEFTKDYDELMATQMYSKEKLISVILSKKYMTPGHRKRWEFVHILKEHFGDALDIFGVGHQVIEDKWDGIAPYKYHLAIENSVVSEYWTEKLADTFLAGTYPFYYGCPNIFNYFDEDALTLIDIDDVDKSIRIIEKTLKNKLYEKSIDKIIAAKHLVLNRYNLFPLLSNYCLEKSNAKRATTISLKLEQEFLPSSTKFRKFFKTARNFISDFMS